jgi:hypothetical protein
MEQNFNTIIASGHYPPSNFYLKQKQLLGGWILSPISYHFNVQGLQF